MLSHQTEDRAEYNTTSDEGQALGSSCSHRCDDDYEGDYKVKEEAGLPCKIDSDSGTNKGANSQVGRKEARTGVDSALCCRG
jgi:hypothetical protein